MHTYDVMYGCGGATIFHVLLISLEMVDQSFSFRFPLVSLSYPFVYRNVNGVSTTSHPFPTSHF